MKNKIKIETAQSQPHESITHIQPSPHQPLAKIHSRTTLIHDQYGAPGGMQTAKGGVFFFFLTKKKNLIVIFF